MAKSKDRKKPFRVLIVDDEGLARRRIRRLLKTADDMEVVAECSDGASARASIEEQAPDLVFLDVQMPEMSGFEALETIDAPRMPVIIFITAYDQYALEAFEINAIDYLLKPFTKERFLKSLDRARRYLTYERSRGQEELQKLKATLREPRRMDRLPVRSSGRILFLKFGEIDWIEAAGNYVHLHSGRQTHLLRTTLAAMEKMLDPEKFLRIHRSTIVNVDRVRELAPDFRGDFVLTLGDGSRLTLSRSYREKFQERFGG